MSPVMQWKMKACNLPTWGSNFKLQIANFGAVKCFRTVELPSPTNLLGWGCGPESGFE